LKTPYTTRKKSRFW